MSHLASPPPPCTNTLSRFLHPVTSPFKPSSDNFDLPNYLLAMVVASFVSTILATTLKTIILKREAYQKSRDVFAIKTVTTIQPRVILSGECYVRWKKKKQKKTAVASRLYRGSRRFAKAFSFKGKRGDSDKEATSAPPLADAALKVSLAEIRRHPWLAGLTTDEAEACKPQVVRLYSVGERYTFVSFDAGPPEKGGRATNRLVIDGYSEISHAHVPTSETSAIDDEMKVGATGGIQGGGYKACQLLILQGGDDICELYCPDDGDHHATVGTDCDWARSPESEVIATHVWYAAILQLIEKEQCIDQETVKLRMALDEERIFVSKLLNNPPATDRILFSTDRIFAILCCRGLYRKCFPKKMKKEVMKSRTAANNACMLACFREESDRMLQLNSVETKDQFVNQDRCNKETLRTIVDFSSRRMKKKKGFGSFRRKKSKAGAKKEPTIIAKKGMKYEGDNSDAGVDMGGVEMVAVGEVEGEVAAEGGNDARRTADASASTSPASSRRQQFSQKGSGASSKVSRLGFDKLLVSRASKHISKEVKLDQDEMHLLNGMNTRQQINFFESTVKLRKVGCCGKIFVHLSNLGLPQQPASLDKFGSAKRSLWPHLVSPFVAAYIGFAGYMAIAMFISREKSQVRTTKTDIGLPFEMVHRPTPSWSDSFLSLSSTHHQLAPHFRPDTVTASFPLSPPPPAHRISAPPYHVSRHQLHLHPSACLLRQIRARPCDRNACRRDYQCGYHDGYRTRWNFIRWRVQSTARTCPLQTLQRGRTLPRLFRSRSHTYRCTRRRGERRAPNTGPDWRQCETPFAKYPGMAAAEATPTIDHHPPFLSSHSRRE